MKLHYSWKKKKKNCYYLRKKLSSTLLIVAVSYQIINGDLDLYWQVLLLSKNFVLYDDAIHYSKY